MNTNSAIIIGAPRSGTNMLRDVLSQLPGVSTWPCDEINYIWRHGNASYPYDQFCRKMATPKIKNYIHKKFKQIEKKTSSDLILEKTCANSLRVSFIDEIFPNAKFIFIVRDGLDVVGSASLRWKAKLDIPYLLKKSLYVPLTDLPYYATRYLFNRVRRLVSTDRRLGIWGPSTETMKRWLQEYTLNEVCALQWKSCVDCSEKELSQLNPNRIIRVQYESFVINPLAETERVANFLGKDFNTVAQERLGSSISCKSIGKGRASLSTQEIKSIGSLISDTMSRYGYAY
jgi:hypothetical protein